MDKIESGGKLGIRSIVAYKVFKGILCLAIAIGFFSISKMALGDLQDLLISYFHIDTESHLWIRVSDQIDKLTATRIQIFQDGFVVISLLNFTEAAGLLLQRKWGAYLIFFEFITLIPF